MGLKPILTNFSPLTFLLVGIRAYNIPNFSFNPFATLMQDFQTTAHTSAKLLKSNRNSLPKEIGFSS